MSVNNTLTGTFTTMLTTELNSLGSGTLSSASTAFNNTPTSGSSSNGFPEAEYELTYGLGSSATTGSCAYVIGTCALDGTNYCSSSKVLAELLCILPLESTVGRVSRPGRMLPANMKVALYQDGGTFSSTGNTLKMMPKTVQNN